MCGMHLVLHLSRLVRALAADRNLSRCHQSLDGNAPEPRDVDHGDGSVYAIPHLGGLHHRYNCAGWNLPSRVEASTPTRQHDEKTNPTAGASLHLSR